MVTSMIELAPEEKSLIRNALDNEIVRLLKFHREWTPWMEANLTVYYKLGGYFTREDFERIAKVKIKEK